MTFRVGMKVVCVNDYFPRNTDHRVARSRPILPRENHIYTVRKVFIENFMEGDALALHLHEVVNPLAYWAGAVDRSEVGFAADRFRPVVENKTDISIFTAMLNPNAKQREREDIGT